MNLIDLVFSNKDNQKVLTYLKLSKEEIKYYANGDKAGSGFDEGSIIFFYDYGAELPAETRNTLSFHNMLINPINGLIFAFQWGRFTFMFRCYFEKSDIANTDRIREGTTLDAAVDFRVLGENWALLSAFWEEEKEQLALSYQLSQTEYYSS